MDSVAAELVVLVEQAAGTISRNIYGHFAEHLGRCVYEGLWVGEQSPIPNQRGIRTDVLGALRRLRVPVLRWPGGCFADEYHWRHGVGPRERRPKTINTHWGGVIENHHFGTHEFLDLCEQLGAAPYVCGNLGSGTIEEMMQWVEYMTSDADSAMVELRRRNGHAAPWHVPYFGVGNESWGCGGNMRPEHYADNFRRYSTFVKSYGENRIQRIACGANGADYEWTEVLMSRAAAQLDGLSLHWYTLPTGDWGRKGSATDFDEAQWHSTLGRTLSMHELLERHSAIMDRYDPGRRVGLVVDEWGAWYDPEPGTNPDFLYQQNTLRDALVAAVNLNLFNQHCERVKMANLAQLVNVLQSPILTRREQMLLTPTYHVFEMYQVHQGATLLPVQVHAPAYELGGVSLPMLHASASRDAGGLVHLSVANLDPSRAAATAVVARGSNRATARVLTADSINAHNSFEHPARVQPAPPQDLIPTRGSLSLAIPPKAVVMVELA